MVCFTYSSISKMIFFLRSFSSIDIVYIIFLYRCEVGYNGNACQNATCDSYECSNSTDKCYIEKNKHVCRFVIF